MALPSEAHLVACGRLIHNFAYCEFGIKLVIGGTMRTGIDETMIALQPYSAAHVHDAAKSLAKEKLNAKIAGKFCQIVGDWFKHNGLRNTVAHSRWTIGDRPNSIKPQGVSIRRGRVRWLGIKGIDDGAIDYTAEDIEAAARELADVGERIKVFIQSTRLSPVIDQGAKG
jgi:hypothetical protein